MEYGMTEPERQAFHILELIDALHGAPCCQLSAYQGPKIETLLAKLEDTYRIAMEPWKEHRTTPGELLQEDFYRWHEYMFLPDVYQEAKWRFNELVTTSRFSVEDEPQIYDLEQVNSPSEEITIRHVVSLAILVCIQFSLDELESLEYLDPKIDSEYISQKVEQAYGLQKQADSWLSHLATLNLGKRDAYHELDNERDLRKKQPQQAARKPRKSKDLTDEILVAYFNEWRETKQSQVIAGELMEKYGISERTVYRRLEKVKINLLT